MREKSAETIAEYKRRRTRQWIASGLIIAIVLPNIILNRNSGFSLFGLPENIAVGVFMGLVIGVVIFSLTNWRCPECNRYLGKTFNPSFCAGCGAQLRD